MKNIILISFLAIFSAFTFNVLSETLKTDPPYKQKLLRQKENSKKLSSKYKQLRNKYNQLRKNFFLNVNATAYTPNRDECDDTPNKTALMEKPKPGWHIAVSRDLCWMLGKRVYIEGLGVRKASDLMNERFKNRIDIMVPTKKIAYNFGKKELEVLVLHSLNSEEL